MNDRDLDCCEVHEVHESRIEFAEDRIPGDEELYEIAELFKVFGDATRLRILFILSETEVCVCDLAEMLKITQPAVSHQLKILRQSKLIKSRREGKSIFYSLADEHVSSMIAQAREHVEE